MNSGTGVCLGLLLWNGRRCGPATGPIGQRRPTDRTMELDAMDRISRVERRKLCHGPRRPVRYSGRRSFSGARRHHRPLREAHCPRRPEAASTTEKAVLDTDSRSTGPTISTIRRQTSVRRQLDLRDHG